MVVGVNIVVGSDGSDELLGSAARDYFDGRDGADTYIVFAQSGFDFYHDTGITGTDRILAGGDDVQIRLKGPFGSPSGIEEISAGGHSGVSIQGSDRGDRYDFSAVDLAGIEKMELGGGRDEVRGSSGPDDIRGNNGADRLEGGRGNDTLMGGSRNDLDPSRDGAHGDDGDDLLSGGAGHDLLAGGANDDTLIGGRGTDTLYGGTGADILQGGAGRDTFQWQRTRESGDTIADFQQGRDVLDLALIDANTALSGDQAFQFAGDSPSSVVNAITYHIEIGRTVVLGDRNGDAEADFQLTLIGEFQLVTSDFLL